MKSSSYLFLNFTRKEKNGIIFLLIIISFVAATPLFYSSIFKEKKIKDAEFKNELASLKKNPADSLKTFYKKNNTGNNYDRNDVTWKDKKFAGVMFYFDPNTLSSQGWKKLGLTDKTIGTIQNYLSKGGRFHEPADIMKIWGLHKDLAEKLLPYVQIEQQKNISHPNSPVYEKKEYHEKSITAIDINNADSGAYITLPGIGPGYAKRIIKFRDKLGGFYKVDQVGETFGLPDSTFQRIKGYLKVSEENIKRININTATIDELKQHPYIRYQLANAIIQYRSQHGNFSSVDDIRKIMLITDDVFIKVAPYLSVQ